MTTPPVRPGTHNPLDVARHALAEATSETNLGASHRRDQADLARAAALVSLAEAAHNLAEAPQEPQDHPGDPDAHTGPLQDALNGLLATTRDADDAARAIRYATALAAAGATERMANAFTRIAAARTLPGDVVDTLQDEGITVTATMPCDHWQAAHAMARATPWSPTAAHDILDAIAHLTRPETR